MKTLTLENKELKLVLSPFGARMVQLYTKDKKGNFADIIQGFETEEEYLTKGKSQGAICGRYANRIANAQFEMNGETFELEQNNGNHCLHGGNQGLRTRHWQVENQTNSSVTFTYHSKHLECGFPGNVDFKITYSLVKNQLQLLLEASTDQATPINLTSHPYFNLKGAGQGSIATHELQIHAQSILDVDDELIPTGKELSVKNTDFDFNLLTPLNNRLQSQHPLINKLQGFDHCYVLDDYGKALRENAVVQEPSSGREMRVFSTYCGLQLFTANQLNSKGKNGQTYAPHSAICLEPQYFPDSPNQPNFPNTIVQPNQNYSDQIIFEFSTYTS